MAGVLVKGMSDVKTVCVDVPLKFVDEKYS